MNLRQHKTIKVCKQLRSDAALMIGLVREFERKRIGAVSSPPNLIPNVVVQYKDYLDEVKEACNTRIGELTI